MGGNSLTEDTQTDYNTYENLEEQILTDYKALEEVFKGFMKETDVITLEHPELQTPIDDFIVDVGLAVKELLTKYGREHQLKKLEVQDFQEQLVDSTRREVKMKLAMKGVEHAVNKFVNAGKKGK